MNRNKNTRLLLWGIIFLAILIRFINLDRIPNGFIPEEVSTGWNAFSLLKTGRDEWGTRLPLVFRETGGFKLALNSYLIVPVMALFGVNEFSVRAPTAFAGVLAVWLTYELVKLLFKRDTHALSAALLLAISPWHIAMGRYGVDVNWGIPLFLGGLILFLKSEKKPAYLAGSGILFALTYYTYFNFVVFTFLFLAGILFYFRKRLWQPEFRRYVLIFVVTQFLFMLPYVLQANLTIRYSQATSVEKIGLVNQIHEHREACGKMYPLIICRIFYNKPLTFGLTIVRNYINHFSTTPYFLHGAEFGPSGMPKGWGFMYPFEFGLLLIGTYVMIRRQMLPLVLILWLFLYGLPSSLAAETHIWRMLTVLPLPQITAGVGLIALVKKFPHLVFKTILAGIILFSAFQFMLDYTSYFPYVQAANSYYGFRETYAYLKTIESGYDHIVIAPTGLGFDQLYIYYVFYMQSDPRKYQLGTDIERLVGEQGCVKVKRIGKWYFESDVRNVIFSLPDKTLFVTDGTLNEYEPLPKRVMFPKLLQTISYPNGNPAFKILELTKNPEYSPEE